MKWKFHLTHTGYCTSNKAEVIKGARRETIRFYATIGILEHPKHGLVLFDVGYHEEFFVQTKNFPYSIYAKITPVFHGPGESAKNRLENLGYSSNDVSLIIISHFHADHIAGLKDFPNAKFICNSDAWNSVRDRSGFSALRCGFIPTLLPEDFEERLEIINFNSNTSIKEHEILIREYDLFGDESIMISELPGHAFGQIGARVQTNSGEIFLIADAAWVKENFLEMKLPSSIVRLFFSSWKQFKLSLDKVHRYSNAFPSTAIIPCHCLSTLKQVNPKSLEF